jgi:heme-degrading monooxygenase HmoA
MPVYQSMQRVRFSSPDGYAKYKLLFGEVRNQLKKLPGFLHLTWWVHPQDPSWYNEISLWTSFEALRDWHMKTSSLTSSSRTRGLFVSARVVLKLPTNDTTLSTNRGLWPSCAPSAASTSR